MSGQVFNRGEKNGHLAPEQPLLPVAGECSTSGWQVGAKPLALGQCTPLLVISLTKIFSLLSSLGMAGILSLRQALGLRLGIVLFTTGLLGAPWIGFGQSAAPNSSQSSASPYPFRILQQHRVNFGQHSITFNRVVPPVFPMPVATPTPAPVIPPPVQAIQYDQLLLFSATVYDHRFSVIQRFNRDGGWTAVSNVDFNSFDIFGFTQGDTFYEIIMALDNESSTNADPATIAWLAQARAVLPTNASKYVVVSGTASADDIQDLDTLHNYFSANSTLLIQAYQQQQAQNAALALQLKLHPPVKPNTVINYWPIKSSVYLPGANR